MSRERPPYWAIAAIIALYLLAAAIEPCDGHSCKGETHEQR
jgi:hypothetical protein